MKRLATVIALSIAALAAPTAASAHTPDFRITGFQFTYEALFEDGGVAGYISAPLLPPTHIGGAASTNGGASTSTDSGIGDISNTDRIAHTFTECTGDCATANGSFDGAAFDVAVAAGAKAPFSTIGNVPLQARLYTFMCKIHPSMRGEISVS